MDSVFSIFQQFSTLITKIDVRKEFWLVTVFMVLVVTGFSELVILVERRLYLHIMETGSEMTNTVLLA